MPRKTNSPPWKPDLDHREWIRAVRHALKLTQTEFGALVGAGGAEGNPRDTEAKWEGGVEPGFLFTRRIVTVAPAAQILAFLGPSASLAVKTAAMSDPERTVSHVDNAGAYEVQTTEGTIVAQRLDEILETLDKKARYELMQECLGLIDKRTHRSPSKLGAG